MTASTILIAWICETCGVQVEPAATPPAACPICDDERQYVGWQGQRWVTPDELAARHRIVFADADGVATFRAEPGFAIGQRTFLIPDGEGGQVMWESLSTVDAAAVESILARGPVRAIAISHPHFYAAMVDWSAALGGVPIFVHERDRAWVQRQAPAIRFWSGERHALSPSIDLVHLGAHFDGSAGLHWKAGPRPGGSLFAGDAVQVAMDRTRTGFMYSYPNMIPLRPDAASALRRRVEALSFDDLYGFSDGRQIIGGAKARVMASFDRYFAAIHDPQDEGVAA